MWRTLNGIQNLRDFMDGKNFTRLVCGRTVPSWQVNQAIEKISIDIPFKIVIGSVGTITPNILRMEKNCSEYFARFAKSHRIGSLRPFVLAHRLHHSQRPVAFNDRGEP